MYGFINRKTQYVGVKYKINVNKRGSLTIIKGKNFERFIYLIPTDRFTHPSSVPTSSPVFDGSTHGCATTFH